MKKLLIATLVCCSASTMAQIPEDALRYSWYPQNGTARTLAIGGAMGSLGGDISATFVNPAGIGFFKTNEFVLSPGFLLNSNRLAFRGENTNTKKNGFGLGTSGFVFGAGNNFNLKQHVAFSLAITQTANFNNRTDFTGLNNFSSFSEQFAEEFARSGLSIGEVLNTNSDLPYTAAPALNAFLIDTFRVNGRLQVKGIPELLLDSGLALRQNYSRQTSGGLYEVGLGAAINNENWLFGASVGIPLVYYKSNTTFSESDTSFNTKNGFKSFTYADNFTTTGAGINVKLGAIYRPATYFRLGIALHTPSYLVLSDERTTNLSTNLETPSGASESFNESSTSYSGGQPGLNKYTQSSAWRAIVSASYVFREIENVAKQRAFITADLEYVNHKGSRFTNNNEVGVSTGGSSTNYFKSLNTVVKEQYRGTFNARAGGELKFNTVMARLGVAYYGNPYTDRSLKANRLLLSSGLGYRNKGVFVDLTYVHQVTKDVNFPYRLADRANSFASINNTAGNVVATIGFKF